MSVGNEPVHPSRQGFRVLVHVLVRRGGRVLLLRRAGTGLADGQWAFPGGHLQAGEALRAAACRELLEETGLWARPATLLPRYALHYADSFGGGLNVVFEAADAAGVALNAEPARCDGIDWFAPTKLPQPVVPYVARLLTAPPACWFEEIDWPS